MLHQIYILCRQNEILITDYRGFEDIQTGFGGHVVWAKKEQGQCFSKGTDSEYTSIFIACQKKSANVKN
jgi:hypothetical protein